MEKYKITFLYFMFVLIFSTSCIKEEDSVLVRLACFEDYQNGYVGGKTNYYISNNKCTCSFERDGMGDTVAIDKPISKYLWQLADSIFLEESAPIYSYWGKTDECEFDEGDLLNFVVTRNGEKKYISHQLGNIYYFPNEIQLTEDHHEYIYSNTFRLFLQYIDLVHAYVLGKEAWKKYLDDLHEMDKAPEADVFPAILQVCDSLNKSKR